MNCITSKRRRVEKAVNISSDDSSQQLDSSDIYTLINSKEWEKASARAKENRCVQVSFNFLRINRYFHMCNNNAETH